MTPSVNLLLRLRWRRLEALPISVRAGRRSGPLWPVPGACLACGGADCPDIALRDRLELLPAPPPCEPIVKFSHGVAIGRHDSQRGNLTGSKSCWRKQGVLYPHQLIEEGIELNRNFGRSTFPGDLFSMSAPVVPRGQNCASGLSRRQGRHRDARPPGPALAELHRPRPTRPVALLLRRQARFPPPRYRRLRAALRRTRLAVRDQLPATRGVIGSGYALIPSSFAAVPPSIATRSASLRPGVPRTRSTAVFVHGYG